MARDLNRYQLTETGETIRMDDVRERAIDELIEACTETIKMAQKLNDNEATRCRQLSLAITNLEQARHWIRELTQS